MKRRPEREKKPCLDDDRLGNSNEIGYSTELPWWWWYDSILFGCPQTDSIGWKGVCLCDYLFIHICESVFMCVCFCLFALFPDHLQKIPNEHSRAHTTHAIQQTHILKMSIYQNRHQTNRAHLKCLFLPLIAKQLHHMLPISFDSLTFSPKLPPFIHSNHSHFVSSCYTRTRHKQKKGTSMKMVSCARLFW